MTTATPTKATQYDERRRLLTLAIYDLLASQRDPIAAHRIEIQLFGISGDWLARRLTAEFRRYGCFPRIEALMARWRNDGRTRDCESIGACLEDGVAQGLFSKTDTINGEKFGVAPSAAIALERILRECDT